VAREGLEVADVFRHFGPAFRDRHSASLSTARRRAMIAIESCRTAVLDPKNRASAVLLVRMLSPVAARSVRGENKIAAAGSGSCASRKARSKAKARPPPAESPATIIRDGLAPMAINARWAESASSSAAGNGYSGARR